MRVLTQRVVLLLTAGLLGAAQISDLPAEVRLALETISADSLRGNLSFLASDLLAGRDTPSQGLDIAAEYIAAQFRRAGLEPLGDGGYFQTAALVSAEPNMDGFSLRFASGDKTLEAGAGEVGLVNSGALVLDGVPVYRLDARDADALKALKSEDLDGKVVVVEQPRGGASATVRSAITKIRAAKPAALVTLDTRVPAARAGQIRDAEIAGQSAPRLTLVNKDAAKFTELAGVTVSIHAAGPKESRASARNVIGILRGSDPFLKDTCVMLSAHYDHLGEMKSGEGDRIFNGANDDASGTVSMIEIAQMLARLKQRPRRTIVFAAFFGEEKGLLGSRYYARHPVFPLAKTVAALNLEQLGRSDSSEGQKKGNAALTGFDFSNVAEYLQAAGKATGIGLYKHEQNDVPYFGASDNLSLAEVGVPAHTMAVTFEFPDYHKVGDEWPKVDFENMARVDRMAAAGLWMLADSMDAPEWNVKDKRTERYREARR